MTIKIPDKCIYVENTNKGVRNLEHDDPSWIDHENRSNALILF